jgi:hypothetical protein
VKVVENTQDTVHLVLPPPLAEGEVTDEALDKVGGSSVQTLPMHLEVAVLMQHLWGVC